jgi:hypothetical protein
LRATVAESIRAGLPASSCASALADVKAIADSTHSVTAIKRMEIFINTSPLALSLVLELSLA